MVGVGLTYEHEPAASTGSRAREDISTDALSGITGSLVLALPHRPEIPTTRGLTMRESKIPATGGWLRKSLEMMANTIISMWISRYSEQSCYCYIGELIRWAILLLLSFFLKYIYRLAVNKPVVVGCWDTRAWLASLVICACLTSDVICAWHLRSH